MNLFFDTETSNLIQFKQPNSHPSQPWVVQLACILKGPEAPTQTISTLIYHEDLPMSKGAQDVHNITLEMSEEYGIYPGQAFELFIKLAKNADRIIAHNMSFDWRLLTILATRLGPTALKDLETLKSTPKVCTMRTTSSLCKLPFPSGKGGYKWPKLEELYYFLFLETLIGGHDALVDVQATIRCYDELIERGVL